MIESQLIWTAVPIDTGVLPQAGTYEGVWILTQAIRESLLFRITHQMVQVGTPPGNPLSHFGVLILNR